MPKYQFELTDTYAGEANYCWVRRTTVEVPDGTPADLLRQMAKVWAGFGGYRCKTENNSDMTEIRPYGLLQVLFITYVDDDVPALRPSAVRRKHAAELARSIRAIELQGAWTRFEWNKQVRYAIRGFIQNSIRFEKANQS